MKKEIYLVDLIYSKFKFEYSIELSTRPEKRIGSDEIWDKAEKALKNVLDKRKIKYKTNKGEGAFYGPKIDFHLKDSLERTWQCGPIQVHRAIYGSLERFIGILLEHYNGRLPLWLAPIQVRILNFTDRNEKYAKKIIEKLSKEIPSLRIDSDFEAKTIQAKVKEAELMKIPLIIVVGEKEEKENSVAVRKDGKVENIKIDKFIENLKKEIEDRN